MNTTKIKLSPALEKRVRTARERLDAALAKLDGIVATAEILDEKSASLDGQIADAESKLDVCDDDAVLRLTAKRVQRDAVVQKHTALDADITAAEQTVFRLYSESQRAVGDAHRVEHEAVRASASAAIAAFFGEDSPQKIGVVEQFPRVRQMNWFCGNAGVSDSPSIEQARRLLAVLDGLLLGNSAFVFEPE